MAVTKSWAAKPAFLEVKAPVPRTRGLVALVCASVLVAGGLVLAYAGKTQGFAGAAPVNLNTVSSAEDLLPVLESVPDRQVVGDTVFDFLQHKRPLPNVGALAPLRKSAGLPLARLKPLLAVRTADEFRRDFLE